MKPAALFFVYELKPGNPDYTNISNNPDYTNISRKVEDLRFQGN